MVRERDVFGTPLWSRITRSGQPKHKRWPHRRLALECLEGRQLLAAAPTLGVVTGIVWNDLNGNGVRDASESKQSGWTVYADTNGNAQLDRGEPAAVSGRDGSYRLSAAPGTYTIREVPVSNWQVTAPVGGSYSVTVIARNAVTGKDFANQYAVGTVAGTIWDDQDGDGVRDTGESGQSGWQVYADANNNGQYDRGESAAVSWRDGSYRLTLTPGTHTIRETSRTGWQVTAPSKSAYSFTIAIGDALSGRDFGNQQAIATVAGTIWYDQDGDGVRDTGESVKSGWQVYADANGNGQYDRGESAAVSGRDGSYRLTLTPGTHTIREAVQSGWQVTTPSGGSYSVTVATGETLTAKDFGNQTTPTPSNGEFDIDLNFVGLSASARTIAEQAAARWEAVIVGDLPDVSYRGRTIDDVSITVRLQSIDGSGNVVGEAGPEALRFGSNLPYLGSITIDTADVTQMEQQGTLLDVLTHEMGHVLGLGTIWDIKGLLAGVRTSNPIFTGTQATAAYNAVFGTQASGVPVEAGGGVGTALGHWRESVFQNELMVGTIRTGGMALSVITVASMADLGYQVDMDAAEPYTPPTTRASAVSTTVRPVAASTVPAGPVGGGATTPGQAGPGFADWGRGLRRWSRHEALAAVDHVFKTADRWLEA